MFFFLVFIIIYLKNSRNVLFSHLYIYIYIYIYIIYIYNIQRRVKKNLPAAPYNYQTKKIKAKSRNLFVPTERIHFHHCD